MPICHCSDFQSISLNIISFPDYKSRPFRLIYQLNCTVCFSNWCLSDVLSLIPPVRLSQIRLSVPTLTSRHVTVGGVMKQTSTKCTTKHYFYIATNSYTFFLLIPYVIPNCNSLIHFSNFHNFDQDKKISNCCFGSTNHICSV
jgi:hypothetical protein